MQSGTTGSRMKHVSLYDRLHHFAAKAIQAVTFNRRTRGEAVMAGLSAPFGLTRFGINRNWDKFVQVQNYRSWVSRCVDFVSEGTRVPPEIVQVAKAGDRARYGVATKQWKQKGCIGDPPDRRKFLSAVRCKAAVGPIKSHEEYEFCPDNHPAVRLVNDPNEFQTGIKLWQQCGQFEELTGESFQWIVEDGGGRPVELWNIPSQWVVPRNIGRTGKMVDFFEVRAVNGPVEVFDADEIIWSKNDSPWHPLLATSKVQAASTTIDAYNMTETARYAALENGVSSGGVITMPPDVNMNQNVMNRLEARFLGKNAGPQNTGRPLILEGGLEWTPPNAEMELAFLQSSDQLRKYTMAHFGLDESMMGFAQHATYAGAVITKNQLFSNVFGPRLENRAALLTERLLPRFGPDLRAIYLPSTTTEDPDARRADWQVAVGARAVTQNEIRTELLGLEPSEEPGADELPGDPMSALTSGDMAGWDDEPGQEKPALETQKPERPSFDGGGKGTTVNRIFGNNGELQTTSKVVDDSGHTHDATGLFARTSGQAKPSANGKKPLAEDQKPKKKPTKTRVAQQEPSEKAKRAIAAHVMVDKRIQRYAEEHNEPAFAKAVGGVSFPDGEPIDVAVPGANGKVAHGIELKTMVVNSNNKITMKGEAMRRKAEWEKKNKALVHTVVLDDTAVFHANGPGKHDESKRRIFYRRGYGSFRVGGMYEVVGGMDEVKKLLDMPKAKLPEGAR